MKKTDLAYIAGIIDGEGCIRIEKHSKQNRYYTLEVSVKMTWRWMPEFLHYSFGGVFRKLKLPEGNPTHKEQWGWKVRGTMAVEFLKSIMPYLKLKKAEAELALLFQSKKLPVGTYLDRTGIGRRLRTDEDLAVEEAQFILMKELKGKGG